MIIFVCDNQYNCAVTVQIYQACLPLLFQIFIFVQIISLYCNCLNLSSQLTIVISDVYFCIWQTISLCHDCLSPPSPPTIVISDICFCAASHTISLCCNCLNLLSLLTIVISDIYFCTSHTICHILEIWLSPTLIISRHLQCHLWSCIVTSLYARKMVFF